uniref:Uncharacterized protein n=1 Tax=Rhizophora mucronata TaxID=61149 RepID=A0A2P2NA00_RHIMU
MISSPPPLPTSIHVDIWSIGRNLQCLLLFRAFLLFLIHVLRILRTMDGLGWSV